jgi:hypothetical protein
MALTADLDESFGNLEGWKGKIKRAGEVKSTKTYITNDETVEFSAGVLLGGGGGGFVCVR